MRLVGVSGGSRGTPSSSDPGSKSVSCWSRSISSGSGSTSTWARVSTAQRKRVALDSSSGQWDPRCGVWITSCATSWGVLVLRSGTSALWAPRSMRAVNDRTRDCNGCRDSPPRGERRRSWGLARYLKSHVASGSRQQRTLCHCVQPR